MENKKNVIHKSPKWKVCFSNKVMCEFDTIEAAKHYQDNEARNLLTYIVGTHVDLMENNKEKTNKPEKSWFRIWLENYFSEDDGWKKIEDKIDSSFHKKYETLKRYNVNNSWCYDIDVIDKNSHRCGISPYLIDKLIQDNYSVEIYSKTINNRYDKSTKKYKTMKIYGLKINDGKLPSMIENIKFTNE